MEPGGVMTGFGAAPTIWLARPSGNRWTRHFYDTVTEFLLDVPLLIA